MDGLIITAQILGGLALLFFGGEWLVRGAVVLAKKLGMSTLVIGLTIVAYGTSAPELVVSVDAALDNHPDIALGNVIGSNISNILLVVGAAALIYPIRLEAQSVAKESVFMLGLTFLLVGLMGILGAVEYMTSALFLALLAGFTFLIFKASKLEGAAELDKEIAAEVKELAKPIPMWKAIGYIFLGLATLVIGANILIPGAVAVAHLFGLSEALIGVTVVAVGGSAPELATSVIAAWRKHSDIAVGNILGSNIFNITGVLGVTGLISPIPVDPRFMEGDVPFLLIATLILTLFLLVMRGVPRWGGGVLMASYAGYLAAQFLWLG